MKLLILISTLIVLTGCGTVDSFKNSQDTDFVIVSQTQAGGVYKMIRGATSACKLSKHGVQALGYTITFRNGECVVSATK